MSQRSFNISSMALPLHVVVFRSDDSPTIHLDLRHGKLNSIAHNNPTLLCDIQKQDTRNTVRVFQVCVGEHKTNWPINHKVSTQHSIPYLTT